VKEKIIAAFKIIRPINAIIAFASVIVAAFICSPEEIAWFSVLLASFAAAFTLSAGNIINDIYDLGIDKVNRPERPLPSGKISKNSALILYFLLIAASLILSWFINLYAFMIVIIATILLVIYSKFLKRVLLVGNILVALLTGLVFIFGGVAVRNSSAAIIPALFAFLINFIREIVKDMQDVDGDKNAGVNTFPIRYGFQKSKILILLITFTLILYTLYPFVARLYKIEYFIIVMIIVNPILVFSLKILFKDRSIKNLNMISNLLKLSMVFGLIAIYLGV
jgi:geranylgeranylglycerol-phosphate geranylgeranyltransferase